MLTQGNGWILQGRTGCVKFVSCSTVCHSSKDMEDEQHFLFRCLAYTDVRQNFTVCLFQQAFSV